MLALNMDWRFGGAHTFTHEIVTYIFLDTRRKSIQFIWIDRCCNFYCYPFLLFPLRLLLLVLLLHPFPLHIIILDKQTPPAERQSWWQTNNCIVYKWVNWTSAFWYRSTMRLFYSWFETIHSLSSICCTVTFAFDRMSLYHRWIHNSNNKHRFCS